MSFIPPYELINAATELLKKLSLLVDKKLAE